MLRRVSGGGLARAKRGILAAEMRAGGRDMGARRAYNALLARVLDRRGLRAGGGAD